MRVPSTPGREKTSRRRRSLTWWIEAGTLKVQVGKVFRLDDTVEAHRAMEENKEGGKMAYLSERTPG